MIRLIGSTCTHSNVFSGGVLMFRFLIGNLEVTYCLDFSKLAIFFIERFDGVNNPTIWKVARKMRVPNL